MHACCLLILSDHQKKRHGGLQWAKGKGRKEVTAEGGEERVLLISSAAVHEPGWHWCSFNSPSHLPDYLPINVHHYVGCSLRDE